MGAYYKLKVKSVIRETEDAVTLVFDNSTENIQYKPGQFLTLILDINGESVRRSYSLCSYPKVDKDIAVTVKKVLNGKASNYLCDKVKEGDVLEVMEPMGIFTLEPDYHKKREIVLIGAGSGITPLMSILKAILSEEPLSKVYLLYGNRNENSVIFQDLLVSLKEEHKERLNIAHVLSQPQGSTVYTGRMNRSLILKVLESFNELDEKNAEYYVCGPKGMMDEALDAFKVLEVNQDNVHKESFLPASSETPKGEVVSEDQEGPKMVTILFEGTEYKIEVPADKTILESALDQDIDLPYSCQSGMCTACMGKCTNGKVHLNDPDGLSQKEIEQGFVLTCVGHPVSGDVVIEID